MNDTDVILKKGLDTEVGCNQDTNNGTRGVSKIQACYFGEHEASFSGVPNDVIIYLS